jgi:hypothetical protein
VLHWCSEYVIPKEGPGTARDEGGTAGADARSSLDRHRVQQAAADEAKKLVDAAALAAERLVDATKEAEATAAAAAASLSPPEEAQVSLSGSTATAAC